ncbi:uncharacterized [Tachysurus ichikawai]
MTCFTDCGVRPFCSGHRPHPNPPGHSPPSIIKDRFKLIQADELNSVYPALRNERQDRGEFNAVLKRKTNLCQ